MIELHSINNISSYVRHPEVMCLALSNIIQHYLNAEQSILEYFRMLIIILVSPQYVFEAMAILNISWSYNCCLIQAQSKLVRVQKREG